MVSINSLTWTWLCIYTTAKFSGIIWTYISKSSKRKGRRKDKIKSSHSLLLDYLTPQWLKESSLPSAVIKLNVARSGSIEVSSHIEVFNWVDDSISTASISLLPSPTAARVWSTYRSSTVDRADRLLIRTFYVKYYHRDFGAGYDSKPYSWTLNNDSVDRCSWDLSTRTTSDVDEVLIDEQVIMNQCRANFLAWLNWPVCKRGRKMCVYIDLIAPYTTGFYWVEVRAQRYHGSIS